MKKLFLLFTLILATSCQQQLEPSVANINSIFETQDFQISFTLDNGDAYRMGFLNNEMAFFSDQETVRRELSYDDVRLINTFVGERFRFRESGKQKSQVEVYNDSKKVVFETANYRAAFEELLQQLNLPYVSTKTK